MATVELRKVETVYQGYVTLLSATFSGPDGETFQREIEHHGRAACVLPYDPDRRTALMVNLPRAPVIWARDMGEAENTRLLEHYRGRQVWLIEPAGQPVRLQPYLGAPRSDRPRDSRESGHDARPIAARPPSLVAAAPQPVRR